MNVYNNTTKRVAAWKATIKLYRKGSVLCYLSLTANIELHIHHRKPNPKTAHKNWNKSSDFLVIVWYLIL